MIFVTVGNATQGFSRWLEAIDQMAGQGFFGEEMVFIQSGSNHDFRSLHCKQEPFLSMGKFAEMISIADLVISHAGAGTLIHVLQAGKVPVVMPRRRKYGELVDDHQIELVQALAAEGRVIPAYEPEDLPAAIFEARRCKAQPMPSPPTRMLTLVSEAIEELMGEKQ
mgnify:CR=1 FL=1